MRFNTDSCVTSSSFSPTNTPCASTIHSTQPDAASFRGVHHQLPTSRFSTPACSSVYSSNSSSGSTSGDNDSSTSSSVLTDLTAFRNLSNNAPTCGAQYNITQSPLAYNIEKSATHLTTQLPALRQSLINDFSERILKGTIVWRAEHSTSPSLSTSTSSPSTAFHTPPTPNDFTMDTELTDILTHPFIIRQFKSQITPFIDAVLGPALFQNIELLCVWLEKKMKEVLIGQGREVMKALLAEILEEMKAEAEGEAECGWRSMWRVVVDEEVVLYSKFGVGKSKKGEAWEEEEKKEKGRQRMGDRMAKMFESSVESRVCEERAFSRYWQQNGRRSGGAVRESQMEDIVGTERSEEGYEADDELPPRRRAS